MVEVAPWTTASRAGSFHGAAGTPEEARTVEFLVDGEPVAFEVVGVVGDPRRWAGRSEHGALVLRLEARDLDPSQVTLVRVADLAPYLASPAPRQLAPGG
jgi:hypothetical protein